MIEAFSVATAHHFQDAFASQARLRYKLFVRRSKLDHSSWGGFEFDEFGKSGLSSWHYQRLGNGRTVLAMGPDRCFARRAA